MEAAAPHEIEVKCDDGTIKVDYKKLFKCGNLFKDALEDSTETSIDLARSGRDVGLKQIEDVLRFVDLCQGFPPKL